MKRSKEWDVVVAGGAGIDYLARGPDLPSPRKAVQGEQFLSVAGGKGLNSAVAAARLGARVALIACVGTDEAGDRVLAQLGAEGVDTSHVRREDSTATGVTLVQVGADGRKQTLGVPGANSCLSTADVEAAASVLTTTQVLLVQLEPPMDAIDRAVRLAHASGARVILDPAPPPRDLPAALVARVAMIKPNASEAETLTGTRVQDRASGRKAARVLLSRGAAAVLVGAGEGSLLSSAKEEHWLPRLPVETVDTTGAGDALAAGLAVGFAEGRSLLDAASFANAVAALATTRLGAIEALPRRPAVLDLIERVNH